jgi:hypothetical protein
LVRNSRAHNGGLQHHGKAEGEGSIAEVTLRVTRLRLPAVHLAVNRTAWAMLGENNEFGEQKRWHRCRRKRRGLVEQQP